MLSFSSPLLYSFLLSIPSVSPFYCSSFCALLAMPLFRAFSSYASCWLLPALQFTLNFPLSRPCSGHLPPMLSIGSHSNPPYPYSSSHLAYIYVHFPFTMHLNPEDGGSTVLRNNGIQPPHYMAQQSRKPRIISLGMFTNITRE